MITSTEPPNRAILAGSGIGGGVVGVKIWLVLTFMLELAPNESVIACERENGAESDAMVDVTVSFSELAPE